MYLISMYGYRLAKVELLYATKKTILITLLRKIINSFRNFLVYSVINITRVQTGKKSKLVAK